MWRSLMQRNFGLRGTSVTLKIFLALVTVFCFGSTAEDGQNTDGRKESGLRFESGRILEVQETPSRSLRKDGTKQAGIQLPLLQEIKTATR